PTALSPLSLHDALPISSSDDAARTSFILRALSPDCELWASSMMTAYRRSGSVPMCSVTNGNFCSVVIMIGTPALRAAASCLESRSEEHTSELQSRENLV